MKTPEDFDRGSRLFYVNPLKNSMENFQAIIEYELRPEIAKDTTVYIEGDSQVDSLSTQFSRQDIATMSDVTKSYLGGILNPAPLKPEMVIFYREK